MKAMILAAGRGERLRPLTDNIPKALLPLQGLPIIAHHLINLEKIGVKEIVINVSYLAKQIIDTLKDGKDFGVDIAYSFEPHLLETGGGIFQALPLLGDQPFIVIAADIFTDYPLQNLEKKITKLAHLIMVNNPSFHSEGDFVLREGKLHREGLPKLTFASIGIYHPNLFQSCKPGFFRLTDVLLPAMKRGEITGEHFQGQWENVTTVEQYRNLL